jgi:hypothetical protein
MDERERLEKEKIDLKKQMLEVDKSQKKYEKENKTLTESFLVTKKIFWYLPHL